MKQKAAKMAANPKRKKRVLGAKVKAKKIDKKTEVPALFLGIDTDAPIKPKPIKTDLEMTPIVESNTADDNPLPSTLEVETLPHPTIEPTVDKTDETIILPDDDTQII